MPNSASPPQSKKTSSLSSSWPFTVFVSLLAPVVAAVFVFYQLDTFEPARLPLHELAPSPVTAPVHNDRMLRGSEQVGSGVLKAPEDVVYDSESGVVYTGCEDGWVRRVTVIDSAADSVVEDWSTRVAGRLDSLLQITKLLLLMLIRLMIYPGNYRRAIARTPWNFDNSLLVLEEPTGEGKLVNMQFMKPVRSKNRNVQEPGVPEAYRLRTFKASPSYKRHQLQSVKEPKAPTFHAVDNMEVDDISGEGLLNLSNSGTVEVHGLLSHVMCDAPTEGVHRLVYHELHYDPVHADIVDTTLVSSSSHHKELIPKEPTNKNGNHLRLDELIKSVDFSLKLIRQTIQSVMISNGILVKHTSLRKDIAMKCKDLHEANILASSNQRAGGLGRDTRFGFDLCNNCLLIIPSSRLIRMQLFLYLRIWSGLVIRYSNSSVMMSNAKRIEACSSPEGLLSITGNSTLLLTDEADGRKFKLTDAVDIAEDGMIYFTDASYKYDLKDHIFDVLEGKPHGRFMSFDPKTRTTRVLVPDIYFANGVAVSPDQTYVVFCETVMRRCKKYYIKGDKSGRVEKFIDDLPGVPDNIHYDGQGLYWIALNTEVTKAWDLALRYPFIRKIIAIVERYVGMPNLLKNGGVLAVDLEGKPIAHYYDPELTLITSAIKIGDYLYCGSLNKPYVIRLNLHKHPARAAT
ncbi:hypothetical protein JRO89_XS08G0113000 [Xanthoceras sorbifolium]|uniref:Strictosidine synthase conserved region domain-containing protein n=1 Tax=Xanthoceras sorbifolium TaxID=99658 RepID=A0ABQ8HPJ0_9ROSI|nr:hypothetical protein JRO89_XS08G0113000 [Xanthoceras sorbifolium]